MTATDRTDALVERLFDATLGTLELYSVYLGSELGLYRALERHGAMSPPELAEHAGIAPRYAVEWLEQQAVAGLLDVEDGDPRRYRLAPDHARVLAHPDGMMYGWSVTHCLPTQMVEQPSAALGTVMRSGTVHELAHAAGYTRVQVLPVENDFFRLYRLS